MTHAEAIRKAAIDYQRGAAIFHKEFRKSMEGNCVLAVIHSRLSAEYSKLARALMRIEEATA